MAFVLETAPKLIKLQIAAEHAWQRYQRSGLLPVPEQQELRTKYFEALNVFEAANGSVGRTIMTGTKRGRRPKYSPV